MKLSLLYAFFLWDARSALAQRLPFERERLEEFYNATGGDYWFVNTSWLTNVDVCDWHGIDCGFSAHPIKISLERNNLTGVVPPSLYELPDLGRLFLDGNNLTDAGFIGLNESSTMENLHFLDTQLTSLAGIRYAPNTLTGLHVTRNPLNQPFPSEIFEATSLLTLELIDNGLFGTLPTEIVNMTLLDKLTVSGNRLTGPIPSVLGLLPNLRNLVLEDNAFSGTLPTELNNMPYLEVLDISNSTRNGRLVGPLLSFWGTPLMHDLVLSGNQFTGGIPFDFWTNESNPGTARVLDLSNNCLTGTVPLNLTRFPILDLDATGNLITTFDTELCTQPRWSSGTVGLFGCDAILCEPGFSALAGRHTNTLPCEPCEKAIYYGTTDCRETWEILAQLYLQTNGQEWIENTGWSQLDEFDSIASINGTQLDVCSWFGVACNTNMRVSRIDLGGNNLIGTVPPELFVLPDLTRLSLHSNSIQFNFASGFTKRLTDLRLDSVGIEKSTFTHLRFATSLRILSLRCNSLRGDLSDALSALSSLTNLQSLDLTNNQLRGTLPAILGDFSFLTTLLLGSNKLEGNITSFVEHQFVTTIDLSRNDLGGTIPPNFLGSAAPDKTIVVNLSRNRIVGDLPSTLGRLDNLTLDLVDNNIENVSSVLCNKEGWNDGAVAMFGCDGILCPPGTFGGRQVLADEPCGTCPPNGTVHFGRVQCPNLTIKSNRPFSPFSLLRRDRCTTTALERRILKEFYLATGGDYWDVRTNWRIDSDFCQYFGIQCDELGRVTDVSMAQNNLTGNVPPSLYELPQLRSVDLSGNDVNSGGFTGLNKAQNVEALTFAETKLTTLAGIGYGPSTIVAVDISSALLNVTIPSELFQLTNLSFLRLADSQLGGTLPSEIGNVRLLEYLDVSANRLIGPLPSELGLLSNVLTVTMHDNGFNGTLPTELNKMLNLTDLDLSNSTGNGLLRGNLLSFDMTPDLVRLRLPGNQFSGTIPQDLWNGESNSSDLRTLDLSDNCLTGSIPLSLSRFPYLDIDISDNFISGLAMELCLQEGWNSGDVARFGCDAITCSPGFFANEGRSGPLGLCQPCETAMYYGTTSCNEPWMVLANLYFQTSGQTWIYQEGWSELDGHASIDSINGTALDLCSWYGITCNDNVTVSSIDLEANNLTGKVPPDLFLLRNLEAVSLRFNVLELDFSAGFTPNLTTLRLDSTGADSLTHLDFATSLETLVLRCNGLGGSLTETLSALSSLTSLKVLDLTNNQLTGTLPPSFGDFPMLTTLLLGSNELIGTLPTFEENLFLTVIDLSMNLLIGSVPENFLGSSEASAPVVMDLSRNLLEGGLPLSLNRFENLTIDLVDNLIDSIPESFCSNVAWNSGAVGSFGCDGILCAPGTIGGRQLGMEAPCMPCDAIIYNETTFFYGQTNCSGPVLNSTSPRRQFCMCQDFGFQGRVFLCRP